MESTKTKTATSEGKTIAIIAYLTIIGLIIAFVMNNDKKDAFVKYHITQSLGLALTGLALGIIGIIPIIGWLINIIGIFILLYMWIMGLINAINDKKQPVPLLGKKYEVWFKNI
ncbi:hypothetical protein ITJ86_10305 [Winogradskyella sp. F6397]|uniref:DUF4870 domain-containing protein n=1 Tax=Winogradskyella marina TaxID=2785530 RepID=A0ABS0EIJ7_9FLAO|nr:hypothetical protein [Winogradskyella marina]MBF8150289.1 hypothetical protein [Winogradskyella marina]